MHFSHVNVAHFSPAVNNYVIFLHHDTLFSVHVVAPAVQRILRLLRKMQHHLEQITVHHNLQFSPHQFHQAARYGKSESAPVGMS